MEALKAELQGVCAEMCDHITRDLTSRSFEPNLIEHFKRCFMLNVSTGKMHRGLSVLYVGQALSADPLSANELKQLCILGCLVELMQAHYLILDDIMDDSTTRRGAMCWYRRADIGTMAINDACLLKSSIFLLLQTYFEKHPAYGRIVRLFVEAGYQTELGQLCDLAACKEQHILNFTMDKYSFLVEYKSSCGVQTPIVVALEFIQLATPRNVAQIRDFSLALGEYFQIHNDYVDVFGDEAVTGAIGTDIQDNKCSWLICQALLLANEAQRKQLQAAYGRKDTAEVERVKRLFVSLGVKEAYDEYVQKQRLKIERIVAATDESEGLKGQILRALFDGFKKGR